MGIDNGVLVVGIVGSMALTMGCSGNGPDGGDGAYGSLHAAIELSDVDHGVTAIRLDIMAPDQSCNSPALFTKTVPLESESLPTPQSGSGTHAFADGLFILSPGFHRVCATPLVGDAPSAECGVVESLLEVSAAVTTEVVLTSQCGGPGNGGLDTVISLNDSPVLTQVTLDPSKFITVCESLRLTAQATDANGDALSYSWVMTSGSDQSILHANEANAEFSGPAGDYVLTVMVFDGHGGFASLDFPVHISDAVCAVPLAVQDIFTARCSPCHTAQAAGGLRLDPAATSYANLVRVGAVGAGCTDRTRVVPGDSATSYLIAKLRGEPDICGLRMPRNRPPLPEEEIATIAAWIDGLPH